MPSPMARNICRNCTSCSKNSIPRCLTHVATYFPYNLVWRMEQNKSRPGLRQLRCTATKMGWSSPRLDLSWTTCYRQQQDRLPLRTRSRNSPNFLKMNWRRMEQSILRKIPACSRHADLQGEYQECSAITSPTTLMSSSAENGLGK